MSEPFSTSHHGGVYGSQRSSRTVICPKCGSPNIETKNHAKRIGGAIGTCAGVMSALSGAAKGAGVGAAMAFRATAPAMPVASVTASDYARPLTMSTRSPITSKSGCVPPIEVRKKRIFYKSDIRERITAKQDTDREKEAVPPVLSTESVQGADIQYDSKSLDRGRVTPSSHSQPATETRPIPGRILRLPAVTILTGLSRSTIYDRIDKKSPRYDVTFPRSLKLGGSAVGWLEAEMLAWIDKQAAAREA